MVVLAWLLVAASPAAALQLAGIFQDGMVLQAEPQLSSVFGTGAVLPGIQAVAKEFPQNHNPHHDMPR